MLCKLLAVVVVVATGIWWIASNNGFIFLPFPDPNSMNWLWKDRTTGVVVTSSPFSSGNKAMSLVIVVIVVVVAVVIE